jgi:hypothetical protein
VTREICARSSPSVAGWTLAVLISGALSYAQQPDIAVPPTPANIQALPNMGQQITPLAPQGSRFEPMNPGLADNPDWLAGQAVTTVVSPEPGAFPSASRPETPLFSEAWQRSMAPSILSSLNTPIGCRLRRWVGAS